MDIEYEATFPNIDKAAIRSTLAAVAATLVRPEFLQKRIVFNLPKGHEIKGGWVRIRDEGDKVTVSLKVVDGNAIEDQKEIYLIVSSWDQAETLLSALGCEKKAYQESKRELWEFDGVEITIDEWPFLEPFLEIEGKSESAVKSAALALGFDYSKAVFGSVDLLYARKYTIDQDQISNRTPAITFEGENPFL